MIHGQNLDKLKLYMLSHTPDLRINTVAMRTLAAYIVNTSDLEDTEFILSDQEVTNPQKIKAKEEYLKVVEDVANSGANIFCISIRLWNFIDALEITKLVREKLPDIIIIGGGDGIHHLDTFLKENTYFDFYSYEKYGEESFKHTLRYLKGHTSKETLKGIYYFEDNDLIKTEETSIDDIDFDKISKVWSLFPPEKLIDLDEDDNPIISIEINRGCVFSCHYCAWGKQVNRHKDLDKVIEDINSLPDHICLDLIDAFCNTPTHQYVLARIKNTFKTVSFHIDQRAYPQRFNEFAATLYRFKEVYVFIGIQSFNKEVLKASNRTFKFELLEKWITLAKAFRNIKVVMQFIMGLPYQTKEMIEEDIRIAKKYSLMKIQTAVLRVLPSTPFFDKTKNWGLTYEENYPYTILETTHLTKEELAEIIEKCQADDEIELYL